MGYWSRSLTDAERAYGPTNGERFTIVWAVLLLYPYLGGTRFTARTDHEGLKCILNLMDTMGKLA